MHGTASDLKGLHYLAYRRVGKQVGTHRVGKRHLAIFESGLNDYLRSVATAAGRA